MRRHAHAASRGRPVFGGRSAKGMPHPQRLCDTAAPDKSLPGGYSASAIAGSRDGRCEGLAFAPLFDMTTKRFTLLLIILSFLAAPTAARANSITLTDWTTGDFANNAANGGGPFKA